MDSKKGKVKFPHKVDSILIWKQPKKNNNLKTWFNTNRRRYAAIDTSEVCPGFGVGVGCGVGFGFGLIGGAGYSVWGQWNHLHPVIGFGFGCGVGAGFGYGQGVGYGRCLFMILGRALFGWNV